MHRNSGIPFQSSYLHIRESKGEKVVVVLASACAETQEGSCLCKTINLVARGVWIYSERKYQKNAAVELVWSFQE